MSNTYTPNVQLAMPASGDRTWNVALNANCSMLDALAPVGSLAVTTTEAPSASLNVKVAPGSYLNQGGSIGTFAGVSSRAMTISATNYLYLDLTNSGTLTVNTTGFPSTAHIRLAVVIAGAGAILSIADNRVAFSVIGAFADGINLTFGTNTGTQVATAPSQKLAFWGKTPVIQQTGGALTAGSSYTSVEQGMINTLWTMARTLGLLS